MNAAQIVNRLIEDELDEPDQNLERYASALGQINAKQDAKLFSKFKGAVRGFMKWRHPRRYALQSKALLDQAKTMDDVQAVLKTGNHGLFLRMVNDGYFGHLKHDDIRQRVQTKLSNEI